MCVSGADYVNVAEKIKVTAITAFFDFICLRVQVIVLRDNEAKYSENPDVWGSQISFSCFSVNNFNLK